MRGDLWPAIAWCAIGTVLVFGVLAIGTSVRHDRALEHEEIMAGKRDAIEKVYVNIIRDLTGP